MKKTIAMLLTLVMASMLLTGCGDTPTEEYSKYVKLGDYSNITVDKYTHTVTSAEVEKQIQYELSGYATYNTVKRSAKDGDIVNIKITGSVGKAVLVSEDSKDIYIGRKELGPEFDKKLIGLKEGQKTTLTVSYEKSFENKTIAGRTVDYSIEVIAVEEEKAPALTDEFVKEKFGDNNVSDYRTKVKENLQKNYDEEFEYQAHLMVMQKIVEGSEFDGYPKDLYKKQYESTKKGYEEYADQNDMSLDELLESFKMDEEDLDKEALALTHEFLVAFTLAEKMNVSISDEEYQKLLESYAKYYSYDDPEEFEEFYGGRDYLMLFFLEDVIFSELEDNVTYNIIEYKEEK